MDKEYPMGLRSLTDKPFLLFYKGELPSAAVPSVAVIGARMCSEYGKKVSWEFGAELAERGIQIISGMASGIDGIAQESALEHGGRSFGILGCGVDICYPSSNRALYRKLQESGGILSEFPPGSQPKAEHFPMRNRIISGLADLILVVEAKEKSGTRITVNMALEQGREVYAVPGRITDELSRGCHLMIREGAGIALTASDVAEAAWQVWERKYPDRRNFCPRTVPAGCLQDKEQTPEKNNALLCKEAEAGTVEEMIVRILWEKEMTADELLNCLNSRGKNSKKGRTEISAVQGALTELVLNGKAVCHAGTYMMKR